MTWMYGSSSSVDGDEQNDEECGQKELPEKKKPATDQPAPIKTKKSQPKMKSNVTLDRYLGSIIPRMTFKEAIIRGIPLVIIMALGSCILFLPKKWVSPTRPTPPTTTPRPRVTLPSWLTDTFGWPPVISLIFYTWPFVFSKWVLTKKYSSVWLW